MPSGFPLPLFAPLIALAASAFAGIDRQALVTRHNPRYTSVADLEFRPRSDAGSPHEENVERRYTPLQVGNGNFAFSVDVTGLQTFIPCNTLSDWGWHVAPLPEGLRASDFVWTEFPNDLGRKIPFPWVGLNTDAAYRGSKVAQSSEQRQLAEWLRANPHRLNLGRLAFRFLHADGRPCLASELSAVDQRLDLWTGTIVSRYEIDGEKVEVATLCDPGSDTVAIRVRSRLLADGRALLRLSFPGGDSRGYTPDVGDWENEAAHTSRLQSDGSSARIARALDATRYEVGLNWRGGATLAAKGTHAFELAPREGETELELACSFLPGSEPAREGAPSFERARAASEASWRRFWQSGAALDFSGSKDPRAFELERRIVLSQYLMAVQEAGALPPQEAGLANNGWYGKFHLEMYWWHAAHYALWNRWPLLERSLSYYRRILPQARALATRQGYEGARWPKMVGPDGEQSPSSIAPFLIWQQPHPLFFAELDYRAHPDRETLERWREVVQATADFMVSLPTRNPRTGRLDLGPPLKTVPENTALETTRNPAYELAYWRFGLRAAQRWRQRLGLPEDARIAETLRDLAPLPTSGGLYLLSESQPDTYEHFPWEHPSLVGVYGMLPPDGDLDRETAKRTLDAVLKAWNRKRVWGWDFPLLALAAARLGETSKAVDLLLTDSPNFEFAPNGFASGGPWPYFPSNGALLYAAAFMAGGWDGAPSGAAPGFPKDGSWTVRAEGFAKAP